MLVGINVCKCVKTTCWFWESVVQLYCIRGGNMNDATSRFDVSSIEEEVIKDTLNSAIIALEERGYNAINQLVGYIISGDLGYISSYKETRNRIAKIDRAVLVEALLKSYVK